MTMRTRWYESEAAIVQATLDKPAAEVAAMIGRNARAVYAMRNRLRRGIAKIRPGRRAPARPSKRRAWAKADLAYLQLNYGAMSVARIARHLGRTETAIYVAAVRHGFAHARIEEHQDRTIAAWADMLGIDMHTMQNYVTRGRLHIKRVERVGNHYILDDATIIEWLRAGNAVRCTVNAHTPHYLRRIIEEVKAEYVSDDELLRIDPWLAMHHLNAITGMTPMPRIKGIYTGDAKIVERVMWYRKADVYARLYNIAVDIPRNIKDPYIKAVWLAWESVYVARYELEQYYEVKPGHPKPVAHGVYVRADVVAWLKTRPTLSRHVAALRQDIVTWQELHADIDRKVRLGQPL